MKLLGKIYWCLIIGCLGVIAITGWPTVILMIHKNGKAHVAHKDACRQKCYPHPFRLFEDKCACSTSEVFK